MQGKLIAIEGIDGVGKNTQALLLQDYIKGKKGQCELFSFPRYNTPTGKKIGDYLRNGKKDLTLEERANLYADDRLAAKEEMMKALNSGIDVVCDRYVMSNLAFFTAIEKIEHPESTPIIKEIILNKEFKINKLPLVNLLIILTLPEDLSRQLVAKKKQREYTTDTFDVHERDIRIQELANSYYNSKDLSQYVILCNNSDNTIKNQLNIHNMIVSRYEIVCDKKQL